MNLKRFQGVVGGVPWRRECNNLKPFEVCYVARTFVLRPCGRRRNARGEWVQGRGRARPPRGGRAQGVSIRGGIDGGNNGSGAARSGRPVRDDPFGTASWAAGPGRSVSGAAGR
ncbi:hypothetical protein BMMON2_18670 [Burkholderia mallei]